MVFRGMQGPTHSGREPVVAGLWYAAHGRTVWLGFACEQHAGQLVAARALLPHDRDTCIAAATGTALSWPGDGGRASRNGRWRAARPPSG